MNRRWKKTKRGPQIVRRSLKKDLAKIMAEQYGIEHLPAGVLMQAKGRYRFATVAAAELARILKGVRSIGLALTGENVALFTIEGSEIFAKEFRQNVIELDDEQMLKWLHGERVQIDERPPSRFIVAKHGRDWLGSGYARNMTLVPGLPPWRTLKAEQ